MACWLGQDVFGQVWKRDRSTAGDGKGVRASGGGAAHPRGAAPPLQSAGPSCDGGPGVSAPALLAELGIEETALTEGDITVLRHVGSSTEKRVADEVADRTACKDFEKFRPLFEQVERELKSDIRKTLTFGTDASVAEGNYFILSGQLAYVAKVGETIKVPNGENDARLRVIYHNGTESNLLRRSLQRALYKDETGRRLSAPSMGPLFGDEVEPEDIETGTIYVLRSKSDHPLVAQNRELIHKMGVTGGKVETRIAARARDGCVCRCGLYQGAHKRPDAKEDVKWHVAMRPGKRKLLDKTDPVDALTEQIERIKASIRAKVEHPFRVIRRPFGHVKVRHRGLAKNTAQLHTLFARANLSMVRKRLSRSLAWVRPKHGKWVRNARKTPAARALNHQSCHVSALNQGQLSFVQTFLSSHHRNTIKSNA